MPARILVIDDHQIMREGLRLVLRDQPDLQIVGSVADSERGWKAIVDLVPDLVLMDLEFPEEGGVALTTRVKAEFPEMKVVVLTAHVEPGKVDAALRAGADGYVLKANGSADLLLALRTVLSGNSYLCPEVSTIVVRDLHRRSGAAGEGEPVLSSREIEVLKKLADGFSTKEIAFALEVSAKTIETHRSNLMEKLGVRSVAELTKYAVRTGLTGL